ncbi:MAG: hypothetical protein JSV08_01160 [Acidobacteriota bacterium]|nr:MAG: hypothetical protein JSV08_01160 [Acidobacteriota bacterium]
MINEMWGSGMAWVVVLVLGVLAAQFAWAHCSLPCGYYDWDHEFHDLVYSAETLEALAKKAQAEKGALFQARAASKNEEWGTRAQRQIRLFAFEYFGPAELAETKVGGKSLLEALHAADKQAYKCKQTLSVEEARKMIALVKEIQSAYESVKAKRDEAEKK